jgi:hypothetical protein
MNSLPFVWAEATPLAAELSKPIRQVSVDLVVPHNGPRFVTLWRSDKTGLRPYTEMHDVAERKEVGVRTFEEVSAPRPHEMTAEVALPFQGEIVVSKLIIHESGRSAESGVILRAGNSDEIVIVAGAYPYSLAVGGVPSLHDIFKPEYPIDRYLRVPLT